jgi:hypothetical protein
VTAANNTLRSPASCDLMLRLTRWVNGYLAAGARQTITPYQARG